MTDQENNKTSDFKEEGSKLKRMSAEKPVKRAGRRGRKPSKIDQKARLERSRQSARECRARKKLRYQYLEELVLLRERSIFSLREELERLRQWCIQMDNGQTPAGLPEMLMAQPSASQATSPGFYTGSDVRQTLINSQRPEAAVSRIPEKNLPLSIPEDFQIPCMPMNCESVNYVPPKCEDYQNMPLQLTPTTNTSYLMQMNHIGEADPCDGRMNPFYNGPPFCKQQMSIAVPPFRYTDYQPSHME